MSIEYEARLIVGCSHDEIGVGHDKLDDLVSCDDIARYATYYDADDEYCNFGVEMSPDANGDTITETEPLVNGS